MPAEPVKSPQQWLNEVLAGHLPLQDAPDSIQSWARFPIYQGAREIVLMDTQDERRAALAKIPSLVRPYVEAEVRRIWGWRHLL